MGAPPTFCGVAPPARTKIAPPNVEWLAPTDKPLLHSSAARTVRELLTRLKLAIDASPLKPLAQTSLPIIVTDEDKRLVLIMLPTETSEAHKASARILTLLLMRLVVRILPASEMPLVVFM
jgi:hypothetical protein